ncbi:MAG: two-component system cell cycle sensor histidine kinase/response regulator CckA [Desulforhopalus sp.]|jgi:two-component system cell cycle sensor histidine kinase/response regulator CckA
MNKMGFSFSKSNTYIYAPVIFVITFIVVAILYATHENKNDKDHFANHAAIISDDIWALNDSGASIYLKLAMKANHYKSVNVSIPGENDFIVLRQDSLSGFPSFLHSTGLIGTKQMSQPILKKRAQIGTLTAVQYVRIIYPLFNILLVLLLILLTITLIVSLFANRRRLEEEVEIRTRNLRHSEQRFNDLVNFLPEIVLETDIDGNITYANQAAAHRLDPQLVSPQKKCFLDFIDTNDHYDARKNFYTSLQGELTELQEYAAIGIDDKVFPVLMKIAPLFTNKLHVGGARIIAIDISSRRQLEEQLLRAQKMKAIGLMAGGVAHDLNNILSGIISYPDLLLLNLPKEDPLYKPLQSIRRSGLEAAEVVSDLLTVARGVAASTEILSLNQLIKNYMDSPDFTELINKRPDVAIHTQLDPELKNVNCSPIQVRKCLMNIINNGIEAIQGKGSLTITTVNDHCSLPMNTLSQELSLNKNPSHQKRMFSKIIITDTGEGINTEEMTHIFEPFYSTKVMGRSGTGLGLTIVWNTMQEHKGTVQVESSPHGTTFELFFPSLNSGINDQAKEKHWQNYAGSGETILVVDDEPRQREILKSLLTSLQYKVVTVSSGEQAEKYLNSNSAHLVVLDMIMTTGQNGRTTYENIVKVNPNQKAIIASGFAKDDDVQATLALGASEYVAKPYTIEQIGNAIYNSLHS